MASQAVITHILGLGLGILVGILMTNRVDAADLDKAHKRGYDLAQLEQGLAYKARGRKAWATRQARKKADAKAK
jgi:hypothetical protein